MAYELLYIIVYYCLSYRQRWLNGLRLAEKILELDENDEHH